MTDAIPQDTPENEGGRPSGRARRIMAFVLVIIIILLLVTTSLLFLISKPVGKIAKGKEAGGLTWVRSIYGWGNAESDQLMTPNDVAIGPDGTIWVTDQARGRIVGFNPDGSYRTLLHQGPVGSSRFALEMPTSVAVDEDGLVYIGDLTADRVLVMDDGNKVLKEYAVPDPRDVAVRGDRIVVGSQAGFVILTKEGDVVRLVGKRGKARDQFDSVAGVEIGKDGTIFVADQFNNRISGYDANGNRKWIREMGTPGNSGIGGPMTSKESTAAAKMVLPARIAVDGKGRLVVADPFDFSLTVLDPKDGRFVAKYGAMGSAEGQFTYPNGVSYDPVRDWFAVADSANSRVEIVRLPGSGTPAAGAISRALSGPLRALFIPLLLILLAVIYWVVSKWVRRMREKRRQRGAGELPQAA